MIRFGDYELDRAQGLKRGPTEIRITPKSLALLYVLAESAGKVVTKEELFRGVWPDAAVTDSALTTCIRELRRVLGDTAQRPQFIETLHRRGYRFLPRTSSSVASQCPDISPPAVRPDAPLIGREPVFKDMLDALTRAEQGSRQVVFVTGEPGIGKTCAVQAFFDGVTARDGVAAALGQCIEQYGAGEPYRPLLEALTRLCRQPGADRIIRVLERCSPTWLAQLPALLTPERLASLQRTAAGTTRERMLRELNDALEEITAEMPMVLWLEDLHWSDVSTLDWLAAFAQRPEPARILLIATFWPPAVIGSDHPLAALVHALRLKRFSHEITLGGLDEAGVSEYLALRFRPATGQREGLQHLARMVHQHTAGNPLFVVNVLSDLVGRGLLVEQDGGWTMTSDVNASDLGIPDDVRRTIERQVDRLLPAERSILEIASDAGAIFSAAAVAAGAAGSLNEVEATLAKLARQHRFVREACVFGWPDGTISAGFEFLHVLYRDVLYERIPMGRRAELHRRVGERQEAAYGDRAPEIAAELAMHFERCRDLRRAGIYLQHAAENAGRRSAYKEAQSHFERALVLLESEPPGPERTQREVTLQIGLGAALMVTRGWGAPEVECAYSRARALCHGLGDTTRLFPALWGLWLYYLGHGPLSTAREIAGELMALARPRDDSALLLEAHHAGWSTAFMSGDFDGAQAHATAGTGLYQLEEHAALARTYGSHDAAVCGLWHLGMTLAIKGRSSEASRICDRAIALAQTLSHPMSMAVAHLYTAAVNQIQRNASAVETHAAVALSIAGEQDFRLIFGQGAPLQGWAAIEQRRYGEGLDLMAKGLAELCGTGSNFWQPYLLGVHADALLKCGQTAAGSEGLEEAFAVFGRTGERFWEAELRRLKGEFWLAGSDSSAVEKAEQAFLKALEIARSQGARLLVLRAAVSLGRLLYRLGRHAEARLIVTEARKDIEGPSLPDMIEADSLLAESGCRTATAFPAMEL